MEKHSKLKSGRKGAWPQTKPNRPLPEGLQGLVNKPEKGVRVNYEVRSGAAYHLQDRIAEPVVGGLRLKKELARLNALTSSLKVYESNWDDLTRLGAGNCSQPGMNLQSVGGSNPGSQLEQWVKAVLIVEIAAEHEGLEQELTRLQDAQLSEKTQHLQVLTAALFAMYRNCQDLVSSVHELLTPTEWSCLTNNMLGRSHNTRLTKKTEIAKKLVREFKRAVDRFLIHSERLPLHVSWVARIPAEQSPVNSDGPQYERPEVVALYAALSFVKHEGALPTKAEVKQEMKNLGITFASKSVGPSGNQFDHDKQKDPFEIEHQEWNLIWKKAKLTGLPRQTRKKYRNENTKRQPSTLSGLGIDQHYWEDLLDSLDGVRPTSGSVLPGDWLTSD